MKKIYVLATAACVAALLLIASYSREPAYAQEKPVPGVQKWEYKVLPKPVFELMEKDAVAEFN